MSSPEELRQRTKRFAIRIVRLYRSLPMKGDAQVIGKQLLRSGTSIGANYRAACRGCSRAEFISNLGTVVEEADETMYWLKLLSIPDTRLHFEERVKKQLKLQITN